MMNARAGFELELHDAWGRRDFAAWLDCRRYYADWLEEAEDPLAGMARAPVRFRGVALPSGKAWLWSLGFRLPHPVELHRSRWAKNGRLNAMPLLGFGRRSMRCCGLGKAEAQFTVLFYGRHEGRSFDTALHPAGFAYLFWPASRTLFDRVGPLAVGDVP